MNCFAHIFIGKEFEQLGQDIGRATYRHGDSAVSYLNYYLLDPEQSEPVLRKLDISSTAPADELKGIEEYVNVKWTDCGAAGSDLAAIFRQNIFNDILGGVNRGSHSHLYVCIHFPFYKDASFKHLGDLYTAIRNSRMPVKTSFIGYTTELADMLAPAGNDAGKLEPEAQVAAYRQFKDTNGVLLTERLLLFQNSFQDGMPLNLTKDSLVETLALLLMQYVEHYDTIYPSTVAESDMVSFGISAIALDKYRFVDYLFCQTMLNAMDSSSIMDEEVSVNEVFEKVRTILESKDRVLSGFLAESEKKNESNIVDAEAKLRQEARDIIDRTEEIMKKEKSMPMRAAILAALLQAKCDLFRQMVYDPDSPDLSDLFVEPIDYFIDHDKSHFYWSDEDTPPVNPIKELKRVNNQLINSESQIRDLRKALKKYEVELANQKSAEKMASLGDDGYYHVNDRKYRLLPNLNEEPLQDDYEPHEVRAKSLDLRDNFREIQDQGSQGSCLAFALTSIFEYVMRSNNRHDEYDLSEAFLYYNARKLDSDSKETEDTGSRFKPAVESLYKYGIAREALCRYSESSYDRKPSADAYADAGKRLLRKAVNVERSVAAIKSALEDGYPVAASFTLCPSFSDQVKGFIPMPGAEEIRQVKANASGKKSKHTHHAMVIVGFDDKIESFLVRNSWGTGWGDKGYCYIPYAYIAEEQLFNYACILTEIESIDAQSTLQKEIPVLRLDDHDTHIRYHLTAASLEREKKNADNIRKERLDLLQQLEDLKQRFSNHNDCETYINRTCEVTAGEQAELRETIGDEQREIEKEYAEFRNVKKDLLIRSAITVASVILLYVLNYKLLFESWITLTILLIGGAYLGYLFYLGHKAWKKWRESKDEHARQIGLCEKEIARKQKEIDRFRYNTQVARKWLAALTQTQIDIHQKYTNIISRINFLRSWYADISSREQEIELRSAVPYTTLLDKQILDSFFDTNIKNDPTYELDFSENLDKHQNNDAYLAEYKTDTRDKIMTQLMNNQRLSGFHIGTHITGDAFADIAKKVVTRDGVNGVSMENVKRQSEIFMHINPLQRGVIMPSTYVMSPSGQQSSNALRQKVGNGFDTYLQSVSGSRMVMLQIMYLQFDECTMFQNLS